MKSNSRIKTVYLNFMVTLVSQFLQIILGFVVRKIFINTLGVEYLGYNSVFLNILQMLNLADLGVGLAVTSFLFKPLADEDKDRVAALMYVYKKIYSTIGCVVLTVGVIISFFLKILIPDATCSMFYLQMLYFINLAGTVSTYFLAYKRTLIMADQKSYVINLVDGFMYFAVSGIQVFCLFVFKNYIVYLFIQVGKNILSNLILSIRADKLYGKINKVAKMELIEEYNNQIASYVKDIFLSRIGATAFYGTDNVIISVFKGSLLAGYLSNYTMITTQLTNVVNQLLASLQATFGNYIYSGKSKEEQQQMTENYFCVNFLIGNFCFICFALLAQSFVKVFFGERLLLTFSTVMWLGINLMLSILLQLPSQVFIIYKLFNYDKPIIAVSAVLNMIISIVLVNKLGIDGVLIGTFVTSLIYLFSRFFIISKYVFYTKYIHYLKRIVLYFLISAVSYTIIWLTYKNMEGGTNLELLMCVIIVPLLSIFIPSTFLAFTKEFKYLMEKMIPNKIRCFGKSYVFGGISVLLIVVSIIFGGGQVTFQTTGNKSYDRTDAYVVSENKCSNIFHLSFDDMVFIFKDLKEKNYNSIFENGTLNWFKELHDKYGVVISCYVYYEDREFNLSQVSDKYCNEFMENSGWLRFGFHSINSSIDYQTREIVMDYKKTVDELSRIVGSDAIDNVIRLQMFQGSYDEVKKLTSLDNEAIKGLLTADDDRQSYYLDIEKNSYIYSHDMYYDTGTGLYFMSTDFRIEYVEDVDKKFKELEKNCWNNQKGDLVVFSHEWALNVENREKIEKVCKYAIEKGYRFEFFEDVLK